MGKFRSILTPFVHRIIVATAILAFALLYLYEIADLKNAQDKLLVNPVIWIIVILYPIIIWQEWRTFKKNKQEETEGKIDANNEEEPDGSSETSAKLTKKIFFFMLSTFVYLLLMDSLGFMITTVLYMPFLMWNLGTKSKTVLIILPIVTTIVLYFLFNLLLDIPLPQGILQGVL